MGGGGGERDGQARRGHQHGADEWQPRRHGQREHDAVARDEELRRLDGAVAVGVLGEEQPVRAQTR